MVLRVRPLTDVRYTPLDNMHSLSLSRMWRPWAVIQINICHNQEAHFCRGILCIPSLGAEASSREMLLNSKRESLTAQAMLYQRVRATLQSTWMAEIKSKKMSELP